MLARHPILRLSVVLCCAPALYFAQLMLSPARSESAGIRQIGVQTQTTDTLGGGQFDGKALTVAGQPFDDEVVTGRPFTADSVIQINQTLADGNRIITSQTTAVTRDGQGRTRSEKIFASASGDGEQQKTVFISDPVKQVRQVFGPDHVVHELPLSAFSLQPYAISISTAHAAPQGSQQVQRFSTSRGAAGGALRGRPTGVRQLQQFSTANSPPVAEEQSLNQPGELKEEHLGTQMIGGVEADGIRTTLTIPVGQVGNESPIVITDERWYSPELQVTVLVKHIDPRFGESSYRLTNIQRTEPPASMFQAPADYPIERPVR
jgi:hypothetical protein